MGVGFPVGVMRTFWKWTGVVAAQRCEGAPRLVHLQRRASPDAVGFGLPRTREGKERGLLSGAAFPRNGARALAARGLPLVVAGRRPPQTTGGKRHASADAPARHQVAAGTLFPVRGPGYKQAGRRRGGKLTLQN